ncbi:cupin domain-containing protein [Nocardioides sp. NPDC127503]|uniref:cupin domain-containing protein n=1 Tax=Nocardioides sp. NPDC127503 TaxID=3154516 RepID=UPI0033223C1D
MTETLDLSGHQRLRVVDSTPAMLALESTWTPGGDPPRAHFHPSQDETFEVLDGELTVDLDGVRRVLGAGDRIEVPRRTVHRMWNAGEVPARATWQVTPALRTVEMFRTIDAGPSAAGLVLMLWTFRHEFRLPLRSPR